MYMHFLKVRKMRVRQSSVYFSVMTLSVLIIHSVFAKCNAEDIPLSLVLDFLRTREAQYADCVAEITIQEQTGPDFSAYWEAVADYNVYSARFFGNQYNPKTPVNRSHTKSAPVSWWRISMLSADNRTFELFNGAPMVDGDNLMQRECLIDGVWERYVPGGSKGPRVFLSNERRGGQALAIFGLVFPSAQISSQSLTELLMENQATVTESESGSFVLMFRIPVTQSAALLNEVILEVDPVRGFAPVRCTCRWVAAGNDHPEFQSRGFTAVWSDWQLLSDQIQTAGKLHISYEAQCFIPRDRGKGFTQLIMDGQVQMAVGAPVFDPESYEVKTFFHAEEIHLCQRLQKPAGLVSPLCASSYPDGTIIQDERTKEVYQLAGAGPAIGNALAKQLEPVIVAEKNLSNRFRVPLIAANLIVLFVISYIIYRRQKVGARRKQVQSNRGET